MAGPIATAIVAVAKFIGGVKAVAIGVKIATIATPLIVGGLKVAAFAAVTKALAPKNKANGLASSGSQLSFKADTQASISFPLGRTGVGGNNIFQYPSGASNKFMNFFVTLGHGNGGPIEDIEGFKANKEAVTFNGAGRATSGSFAGKMWMTMALGLMPATALAIPSDIASTGAVSEWTSAHKLSGYAAARWTVEYDAKVYPSGVPQPEWVVKGIKVYDPRKDSTYPGGSGAHRLGVFATYEFSENPYIHGLNYCLGYFANGKRVGGAGASIDMLDVAAFIEGANVADANGWKVGGVVTSLDSKWGALKAMLQAGSGEPVPAGAKISCRVDTPRSSLATLTEADIAGPVHAPAVRTRRDRKNSIIPRYRSEAHNWEIVSAKPVTSSTYQTEDGGLRQKEVEYTLCQDAGQAAQLAAYDLVNAREIEPITLSAKPKWQGYRVGECITLNLPERGFVNQKAVIVQRALDLKTGVVTMALVSETDAKHAFALGQTPYPPATPGLTQPDFANVPYPGADAWTLESSQAVSSGLSGASLAVVGANDYAFTSEVVIRLRPVGTPEFSAHGSYPATTTRIVLTGLVEGNFYDVAISYRSIYGVTGPERILTYGAPGLQPLIFEGVSDGDVLVFDPPLSGVPTFDVDMSGCLTADPGDTQLYRLTDLTTTGAVVALKISDNTETTAHEVEAAYLDDDGNAVATKPTAADAYNGSYKFTVTVERTRPATGAAFMSFAPILVRPAGAPFPSGLIRIGEVGGSSSGPVACATQSEGEDTYTVTLPCSVVLGTDGGPQFYAINTGNVGRPESMVVEYDTEVTGAVEIPATDATHKATITFYPPGYTGTSAGSGTYFDGAAAAAKPLVTAPEVPDTQILAYVGGTIKRVPYAYLPSGSGGDPDPYALSNIDSQGGTESALNTALAQAQTIGIPLTGDNGSVTITAAKTLTGCHIHLPYKVITFGANLGAALTYVDFAAGSTGAPSILRVTGPAIELGGSPANNKNYEKVLRVVGGYSDTGVGQSQAFTAIRIQGDQASRSSYDIGLQSHRGDGLEINSNTEKKLINYRFNNLFDGYALTLRHVGSDSPDEVKVNLTGTFGSNLVYAQEAGQYSYRVDFLVESIKPWIGTYAVDECSRKGSAFAGEIRGIDGDLIKVETRASGYSSAGPTVVFDSLRIIQHYCGRITIINPKSVGGTIYHDQVDTGRQQGSNYTTAAYRNSYVSGQVITLVDQPSFQIGAVLENCTLTYVSRRNVSPYGARIGISDWVNPVILDDGTPVATERGSAFSGKTIRLEIEMGDRNIDSLDADGKPLEVTGSFATTTVTGSFAQATVTGSFSGTTFTVTAGGSLAVGRSLSGTGIPAGMRIASVVGGGVYTVTIPATLTSMTVSVGTILTVTAGATLAVGQWLEGTDIPLGTRVLAVLATGSYLIDTALNLSSRTITAGCTFTQTAGEALIVGQFLKGAGLPVGLRVTSVSGSTYGVNRGVTASSMQVMAGATPDMFYAIWADFGTRSTIWAEGNLAGNILISEGWQQGTINVSAAWVRAGYVAEKHALASTQLVIHGPMDLAELADIAWAFRGVKVLTVNDFDGAGASFNGSQWVPLSPPLIPELSMSAMGSPYNAGFIKRKGLSVVNSGNALPYYATGDLEASTWQTPGGTSITPGWDVATTNFESRAGSLSIAYKLAFDRFIYDLRLAGVYTGTAATSKMKGLWPLIGPSDAAAKNNLLFDFWDLNPVYMDAHQPGIGFMPYASSGLPGMEVLRWDEEDQRFGTSPHNLMMMASCGTLLNSAQSSEASGGPYFTGGGYTAAFRLCFHRSDGGNHAQINTDTSSKISAPSQANSGLAYRIGMAWTPHSASQSIRMFGGPTATGAKGAIASGFESQRIFFGHAHDYHLRVPIEIAGLGSGDFTSDEAAATLAAVNTLRSALKALA